MLELESIKIIEHLDEGYFITDNKGKIIFVNSAYETITGIRKADLIGKSVKQVLQEGYYDKSVSLEVLNSGKVVKEVEIIKKTNKKAFVVSTPIFDTAGQIELVVTTVRDIADLIHFQKKLEDAKKIELQYRAEKESWSQFFLEQFNIIANSIEMKKVMYLINRVANMDTTVLIRGETGVGKGVVANLIHELSIRKEYPFIKIDCGAVPENLIESELFGYEKGAFTGADVGGKIGLVELANKGTLFLDEIGELPLITQPKILRLVQDKEYIKVGGRKIMKADIRILAATNRELDKMVENKKFREDLFYRLNVFPITIPPLRQRRSDILHLANHFLSNLNAKYRTEKRFSRGVLQFFVNHSWKGNVRELENLVEHLYIVSEGSVIYKDDVFLHPDFSEMKDLEENETLQIQLANFEKELIKRALNKTNSIVEAAALLGVHRTTLKRKIDKYKIP